jgi:hypothetical protein
MGADTTMEKLPDAVSTEEYRSILTRLLHIIGYRNTRPTCHPSIQKRVTQHFLDQSDWHPDDRKKAIAMSTPISVGVAKCYPQATPEAQLAYSLHCCYILFLDDRLRNDGTSMGDFATHLLSSESQRHPILLSYTRMMLEAQTQIGPYAASMSLSAANNFITGIAFEHMYDGKIHLTKGALAFPSYLRTITGISEPVAHYIFPQHIFPEEQYLHIYLPCIPDLVDCINWTNDITSFYKESIVGRERLNYVCNVANVRSKTYKEALIFIVEEFRERIRRIRYVLREWPDVLQVVEEFFSGYVLFHLEQPRYLLKEVLGEFR